VKKRKRNAKGNPMSEHVDRDQEAAREKAKALSPRTLRAEELFRGDHEIWIEHAGDRYRLRITRRNKLILQK
jgi:hemin uptake protein HemP